MEDCEIDNQYDRPEQIDQDNAGRALRIGLGIESDGHGKEHEGTGDKRENAPAVPGNGNKAHKRFP